MTTPEGRIKAKINRVLQKYRAEPAGKFATPLYWEMNVPGGYGRSGLDYIGASYGRAFAIEAKAEGEHPSPRQKETIKWMRAAHIYVMVIGSGPEIQTVQELRGLDTWLNRAQ